MGALKGWRTIAINGLTFIVALVAWPEVVNMVDAQVLLLISSAANIGLRILTNTKAGKQ